MPLISGRCINSKVWWTQSIHSRHHRQRYMFRGANMGQPWPTLLVLLHIPITLSFTWASDESCSSLEAHHQVEAAPIGYQCLVIYILGHGCWRSGRARLGYSNWCVHPCLLGFWRKLLLMFFCNIMFMQPLPSLKCRYPFTFGFAWLSVVAFCIQVKIGFQQLGRKLPDTTVFLLTCFALLAHGELIQHKKENVRQWDILDK